MFMIGLLATVGVYAYFSPQLPSIETLKEVRLQVPLKVYTRDRELIAEFGEKRRSPLSYDKIPPLLVKAFLSAEDDRFFEHPGVDYQGILRALSQLILTGEKKQGGSTITMQLARNFFLSNEKTYERKIKEILLALKIERSLDKEAILELYLNKIYLGNRAYGVGAAGEVYYGLPLQELDTAQIAMIAGLPKAPSRYNPLINPQRAIERRNYVLRRMLDLSHIDADSYEEARNRPVTAYRHAPVIKANAQHAAEMVRLAMLDRYGDDAYTSGLTVITTIDQQSQRWANLALRKALDDYDRRHGYRGPEGRLENMAEATAADMDKQLAGYPAIGSLIPAVVIQTTAQTARAYIGNNQTVQLDWPQMKWARPYIDENRRGKSPTQVEDIFQVGDIIRLQQLEPDVWRLAQIPDVAGALISLNPADGAILGLVGSYDFYYSKYNRVAQSRRQPGSGFKPILYAAALEQGFTPASTLNDSPIVFKDPSMPGGEWRPENYSSKFFGPTRLREALYKSRNLVSVRLIDAIGVSAVRQMANRLGFSNDEVPNSKTIALGSGQSSPLRMSAAYATFANGGFRVKPYLIDTVTDNDGKLVLSANPHLACRECLGNDAVVTTAPDTNTLLMPLDQYQTTNQNAAVEGPAAVRLAPRVLSPQVHYQITSMLKDVVKRGTARKAMQLGRQDLAGKTGTTNDQYDAWFNGFNPDLVTIAWVGFDRFAPLGRKETGGNAALPMWMNYMRKALQGKPERPLVQPDGMVTIKIDPKTGLALAPGQPGGIFETFRKELTPATAEPDFGDAVIDLQGTEKTGTTTDSREGLF